MPKRCTLGCEQGVGTHRFPNPRKFLNKFRKWVLISGGDPDDPIDYEHYQKCIMCDKHFDAKDRTRYNRLSCLAIPCLNLPPSAAKIFEEIKRNDDNGDGDTEMNDTQPDPCDSMLFESDTPEVHSEFEVQENLEGEFISKGHSDPEGQSDLEGQLDPEGQLTPAALSEPAEIEKSVEELTPVVLSKPTGQLKPVILTNIKGQLLPVGQSTPVVLSKPVGQLKPVVLSNSGHSKPAGQLTPALSNHNGQLMPVGQLRPAIKLKSLGHLHPAGKFIPVGQLKPIIKLTPIAQTPVGKAKRHIHCAGSHVFRRKYDPDVPICRACLTTKRKLYNIHETDVLDIYQQMSGTQVTEDDCLSKLLCSHCVTLLRKCNTFSQNCKEAAKALKEATFTNYLPEASKVQNLKFYRTNINHIDIVGGNCVKMEINQDNDGDTMVDDTGVSEPMDIANEIEIKDVNKIRKKKPNVLDDENKLKDFEDTCNVDVHKLSSEEKLQDVLDRKSTPNYLNSPHRCELCFKGFLAANLLTNHFLMHHDPSLGSEVCEYCQFRYKTANDLSAHYTTRHTTKMSCRLCPKVSRNVFEAKKHHDVYHNGQKYTTCEHCGRGFRVQSTFLVHLRDEHPSELIWCNVCGDSFVLAETLDKHKQRRHRDIHLPVQCERCDVQLADEAALDRHSLDGVCTGHTCLHCGLGYNDAMALRDHIIKTHRKTSNMLYPCPKCHKVYKQGAQLRDHLKYVHLKLNRKVICEICGKVVPNKNAMKVHLRVHTGERPYECPVCMKGFISKDTMMKHRNYVHSTARPYVCDRCPKSFKGKHNLTQHERAVHDNETTTASQTLLSLGLIL